MFINFSFFSRISWHGSEKTTVRSGKCLHSPARFRRYDDFDVRFNFNWLGAHGCAFDQIRVNCPKLAAKTIFEKTTKFLSEILKFSFIFFQFFLNTCIRFDFFILFSSSPILCTQIFTPKKFLPKKIFLTGASVVKSRRTFFFHSIVY